MTTYIWTTVVLYGLSVLANAYLLGSGTPEKPALPGAIAVRLVIRIVLVVWGLRVLGAL